MVGSLSNILTIHIEGGELSGTIDDSIRHSITKLAHIHCVANEEAKKRTMQLGETPDSIYVIGSPDLDLMNPESLPSLEEVKEWYQIKYEKYAISMLHPVTTEYNIVPTIAKDYFEALKESEKNYIAIYPNNDLGSEYIVREIEKLEAGGKFRVFRSIRFGTF